MAKFKLSERQSQAILDMRLRRLTGLERDKIQSEYDDLVALIADLADILAKPERVATIIKEELEEVKRKFGDARRTELMVGEVLSLEAVSYTHLDVYKRQDPLPFLLRHQENFCKIEKVKRGLK